MAQLRIGHEQVTFYVDTMKMHGGAIQLTASTFLAGTEREKAKKLTGSQPIVLVGDDNAIIAAWHFDATEIFKDVREMKYPDHVTIFQPMMFESVRGIQ